jgi:hypothetical protein
MTIQAKPIVPDQFWILTDSNGKVGNIQSHGQGFRVRIHDKTIETDSIDSIKDRISVRFERPEIRDRELPDRTAHGYPTSATPHNVTWDVRRQAPIWTKSEASRSWHAAGWYRVRLYNQWRLMFCPKVILLDRYENRGPFFSAEEARRT